jgi:alcohol dehydrogenase-like protein
MGSSGKPRIWVYGKLRRGSRAIAIPLIARNPNKIKESIVRGAVMYAPGDVRVEERPDPQILKPTDAILRLPATCICGSDLWPYWGIDAIDEPRPMGHEYVGIVEEVGSEVKTIKPGQFVVGSFWASDNTCEICQAGYQCACVQRVGMGEAQAERLRVPLADGTLVATPDVPPDDLIPSFMAASDVLGTGWFGAVAADAGPGKTVAVVGDGAVGLLAVLAAKQLGAERIIAMSRHQSRQKRAMRASRRSRTSPTGWVCIRLLRQSARSNHLRRPLALRVPAGTSVSSACFMRCNCPGRSCSGRTYICTAAQRQCAGSCPSWLT